MLVFIVELIEIATLKQSRHEGERFRYYYVNLSIHWRKKCRCKKKNKKNRKTLLPDENSNDFAFLKKKTYDFHVKSRVFWKKDVRLQYA